MKRFSLLSLPVLTLTLLSWSALAQEKGTLETDMQKFSYMLGMDVGGSIKRMNLEFDVELFKQALNDVLEGRETLLTPEQAAEIKQAFMLKLQEQRQAAVKAMGDQNRVQSEAFLAENKTKDGVRTTESGLQYQVIKEGDGPKPQATDTVTVHYRGTLIDGSEFDSSYGRGQPASFPVNGVIPGWTEALQLMPVGSSYKLFIPADLAYGERGAGGRIGPNQALVFEVELLGIESQDAQSGSGEAKQQ